MNARNNSDKLCDPCGCSSSYNAIHNVEDVSGSGTITEPVTLQQVKDYLRLEGFLSDDDSPGDEFDFDDGLITSWITEGRQWCEMYLGGKDLMVGLIPRTIQVFLTNGTGMMQIPGPVTGTISWKDQDGAVITAARLIGAIFPKIESETCDRQVLEYEAGYGIDCPKWAQNAILAYIAWAYEHRGDETLPGSPVRAAAILRPYRRVKVFA